MRDRALIGAAILASLALATLLFGMEDALHRMADALDWMAKACH